MEVQRLKPEILEKIKKDPILFGEVANSLKTRPANVVRLVYSNSHLLTQFCVVKAISTYYGWTQVTLSEVENKLFGVKTFQKDK